MRKIQPKKPSENANLALENKIKNLKIWHTLEEDGTKTFRKSHDEGINERNGEKKNAQKTPFKRDSTLKNVE